MYKYSYLVTYLLTARRQA